MKDFLGRWGGMSCLELEMQNEGVELCSHLPPRRPPPSICLYLSNDSALGSRCAWSQIRKAPTSVFGETQTKTGVD